MEDIRLYFTHYKDAGSAEQKIKFASGRGQSVFPGRQKWNKFVAKMWQKWKIHNTVVRCFRETGVHPVLIMTRANSMDQWPPADLYIPKALDAIAMELFGPEVFEDSMEILSPPLARCLTPIAQRAWNTIRAKVKKDRERINEVEAVALGSFRGNVYCLICAIYLTNQRKTWRKGNLTKQMSGAPSAPWPNGRNWRNFTRRRTTLQRQRRC